jgi:hypothetical protein
LYLLEIAEILILWDLTVILKCLMSLLETLSGGASLRI